MSFGPLMNTLGVRRHTLSVMHGFLELRFGDLYVVQRRALRGAYASSTRGLLPRHSFRALGLFGGWAMD